MASNLAVYDAMRYLLFLVSCESLLRIVFFSLVDPCLSNPCMAGGTCAKFPLDGHFFCTCPVDNVGLQCELGEYQ